MNVELLSILGGGLAGFVFRFMASQQAAQAATVQQLIGLQTAADDSADRAAARGSHLGRRVLVFTILWVLCLAPFIGAIIGVDTFVETPRADWDLLGLFTGGWEKVSGIIIIPELRTALLAAVGFYLGGSAVSRGAR